MKLETPYSGAELTAELNTKVNYLSTFDDLRDLTGLKDGECYIITHKTRGGIFIARDALAGQDNDGTIVNGCERQYKGLTFIEWFGADDIDIVPDSTSAINACIQAVASFDQVSDYNTDHKHPTRQIEAGVGRNREIGFENKVYGVSEKITFYHDTVVEGNGAAIKWVGGASDDTVVHIDYSPDGGSVVHYAIYFNAFSHFKINASGLVANALKITNAMEGHYSHLNLSGATKYGLRLEEVQYSNFNGITATNNERGCILTFRPNGGEHLRCIDNVFETCSFQRNFDVGLHLCAAINNKFGNTDVGRQNGGDIIFDTTDWQIGTKYTSVTQGNKFFYTKHEHSGAADTPKTCIVLKNTDGGSDTLKNNVFYSSTFSHQSDMYFKWFASHGLFTLVINPIMQAGSDAMPENPDIAGDKSMFISDYPKGLTVVFQGWRPDKERIQEVCVQAGTEDNNPPTYITDDRCNIIVESDYRYYSAPIHTP